MSSEELAVDLAGAEQLLEQHEELGREIEEHCLQAQDVQQEGRQLVENGHFMSPEVQAQRWPGTELGAEPDSTRGLGTPSRSEASGSGRPGQGQRGRDRRGGSRLLSLPSTLQLCTPAQPHLGALPHL